MSNRRTFTQNPVRPARYRAGKVIAAPPSDEESEVESDVESRTAPSSTPVFAPSRHSESNRDLNIVHAEDQRRLEFLERDRLERDAGFVTESEEDGSEGENADSEGNATASSTDVSARVTETGFPQPTDPDGSPHTTVPLSSKKSTTLNREVETSSSGESSSDEDSEQSSEDDDRRRRVRPIFIRKQQRGAEQLLQNASRAVEDDARRRRQGNADSLIQHTIEQRQAEREAQNKEWDDDVGEADENAIDDSDGVDPELERQQWILRELARLKRARAALEEQERELAEVDRRRRLTSQERDAEDRDLLNKQLEEKQSRQKAQHMQRYHHKGAFYQEDAESLGLRSRDLMGASYEDQSSQLETLPEYLQVRDATKIGRKGRTRYKDLRSEDTGKFGLDDSRKRNRDRFAGDDDRFRPDYGGGSLEVDATGANASSLGERRPLPDEDVGSTSSKKARMRL